MNALTRWLNERAFRVERLNGDGACDVYMYRWTLLRVGKRFAVYLHHFVNDDWSTDFHDHPKRFVSIGLWGSYVELTPRFPDRASTEARTQRFRAPWIRSFSATHRHRIILRNSVTGGPDSCWTLCIVGRPTREWGFWHNGSWMHWRAYVSDRGLVQEVKSCP